MLKGVVVWQMLRNDSSKRLVKTGGKVHLGPWISFSLSYAVSA